MANQPGAPPSPQIEGAETRGGQAGPSSDPLVRPDAIPLAAGIPNGGRVARTPSQLGEAVPRVFAIDPQSDPRWEAFLNTRPDGLIYHHPAWLQVLEKAYGHTALGLACEDADGQLQGILPLFHTRGLLTGRRLSSLPHTPVAGPLGRDDQATAALVRAALEQVRGERGAQLQLKTPSAGLGGLVDGVLGVPWEATYILELPQRPEELRFGDSRNHTRIKGKVNKAAKQGVRVRPAETERDLRVWYALYVDTMRWHIVPPRPYRFFEVAWQLLRPRGLLRLLLAERHEAGQSQLLAGSIFLMFGQTVFYAFNGRRREALSLEPNDAIQWQAIHDACRDGFRRYDFGEVAENNQGLAAFKSKWGALPMRLYRYYYPASRELETGALKAGSRARQLANAAWRRLPAKATILLGDWLYRYL
ncbi:MAG: GNAT family N-acetyltransferase [Chloroflexota bacterium]|nr:GNAT family N-acetyltransferase [Chloroflexota bacterium]